MYSYLNFLSIFVAIFDFSHLHLYVHVGFFNFLIFDPLANSFSRNKVVGVFEEIVVLSSFKIMKI